MDIAGKYLIVFSIIYVLYMTFNQSKMQEKCITETVNTNPTQWTWEPYVLGGPVLLYFTIQQVGGFCNPSHTTKTIALIFSLLFFYVSMIYNMFHNCEGWVFSSSLYLVSFISIGLMTSELSNNSF